MSPALFLGIDVGTTGVRACAIDEAGRRVGVAAEPMPAPHQNGRCIEQDPEIWWQATEAVLRALGRSIDLSAIRRLAVDGTSGTLLLIDREGRPRSPGLMYNDTRAIAESGRIKAVAPPESGAHGATSALAKLLHLLDRKAVAEGDRVVHQADWIAGRLAGRFGFSDGNNALKLGYDPIRRAWPEWLRALGVPQSLLPTVRAPGALVGRVHSATAAALGLAEQAEIRAGTTDGVASFIATGASQEGDAVTSLGSTLVVKLVSHRPVFDPSTGVYSHRLGERWLAGGASNSGGAALLAHFTQARMAALTPRLDPARPTELDYYPLPSPGERFPFSDPAMLPRVSPRPDSDLLFFQGLLEGIANIERRAYERLVELGAPPLRRVLTVGGGATNAGWTELRARRIGVEVATAEETEASFGTALLALHGAPP
jgi:hypothetical protein